MVQGSCRAAIGCEIIWSQDRGWKLGSSGEIEDTSETVRSQHALRATLSPSTCRNRLTCPKVSPSPNLLSVLQKPALLLRYHHLKNLVPRNLRAAPRQLKCRSSLHPPNQLYVQLPEVAERLDHRVTLRTLLLPNDIAYHSFYVSRTEDIVARSFSCIVCIHPCLVSFPLNKKGYVWRYVNCLDQPINI